jgi:hypothetical protein
MAPYPTLPFMNVPVPFASRDNEDILERLEDRPNQTTEDSSFHVGLLFGQPVRPSGQYVRAQLRCKNGKDVIPCHTARTMQNYQKGDLA